MAKLPHAPKVYELYENGYRMEMMDSPRLSLPLFIPVTTALIDIHRGLEADRDWQPAFDAWRKRYPWIGPAPVGRWCRIHGDSTLANVMLRHREVVLIDPLAPEGRYIPSYDDVDFGKLLQSCLGWESILQGTPEVAYWTPDMYEFPPNAWYWASVHCARIMARAKRTDIYAWAERTSYEASVRYGRSLGLQSPNGSGGLR
jgi:hypothetical protein